MLGGELSWGMPTKLHRPSILIDRGTTRLPRRLLNGSSSAESYSDD
jgi:hypothetical protein